MTIAGLAAFHRRRARPDALRMHPVFDRPRSWTRHPLPMDNLATGPRAGAVEGRRYDADLTTIEPEASGTFIDDDSRFYPIAATYYRVDLTGGELWFGLEAASPDLGFAVVPTRTAAPTAPCSTLSCGSTAPTPRRVPSPRSQTVATGSTAPSRPMEMARSRSGCAPAPRAMCKAASRSTPPTRARPQRRRQTTAKTRPRAVRRGRRLRVCTRPSPRSAVLVQLAARPR